MHQVFKFILFQIKTLDFYFSFFSYYLILKYFPFLQHLDYPSKTKQRSEPLLNSHA
jgi:hypothetical protein